jgi:hypothetical protein
MNAQLSVVPVSPDATQHALHARLGAFNARRLKPGFASATWQAELRDELAARVEEGEFVERERAAIEPLLVDLPSEADAFMQWFERLRETGPGQNDPLFPWLANVATMDEMRWFLVQEVAGEAGFDDLVALTQVRFPTQPKLEMARNYWDEMGRGKASAMHGPMLDRLARELKVDPHAEQTVWESTALANLLVGLAANRDYAYQSIGALGAIELTAPSRATFVDTALTRLGLSTKTKQYYALHAVIDVKHSAAWNTEIIAPLVEGDPSLTRAIAEGALMRLQAGARCFEWYRRELLGVSS